MKARHELTRLRAPDESAAQERAWAVVSSAVAESRAPTRSRPRLSVAAIPALAVILGAVALSPAGASVSRLLDQALGVRSAARSEFSLPAPGRLLLSGGAGTWTVSPAGASRHLGPWRQASWSPHAKYIAAVGPHNLVVVDPEGRLQWALERPAVSDPRWFGPSGVRIAYLSGRQLRVVAGDGSGDHLLASAVAHVAPAWRSNHAYQLVYATGHGRVVMRDGDTGRLLWGVQSGPVRSLQWSADGGRLLVLTRTAALVYDAQGRLVSSVRQRGRERLVDAAISPDGEKLAVVRGGRAGVVAVASTATSRPRLRLLMPGTGITQATWAPDGRWVLVSWPAANQWVFIRAAGPVRILAVSRISRRYSDRTTRSFPTTDGWCCTAPGN
jgi:YD repeat-containing protein